MRVDAAIATACLLTSGCSAIVKQPSVKSVLADGAGLVTGVIGGMNVHCRVTDGVADQCFGPQILAVYVGVPAALLTAIFGGLALATDEAPREPEMPTLAELHGETSDPTATVVAHQAWDSVERESPVRGGVALPAIQTDPLTLRLARQAKASADAGQCVAARATMDRIAARDADYHLALQIKGVLGVCP